MADTVRWRPQPPRALSNDPHSPWQAADAWWLNSGDQAIVLTYAVDDAKYVVRLRVQGGGFNPGNR